MKLKELLKNIKILYGICAAVVIAVIVSGCLISYQLGLTHADKKEQDVSAANATSSQEKLSSDEALTLSGSALTMSAESVTPAGAESNEASQQAAQSAELSASKASPVLAAATAFSKTGAKGSAFTQAGANETASSQADAAESAPVKAAVPAGGATASYAGKLKVIGNQLCTADGAPIQLRGVSTHGLSWFPEYVNASMFGELKNWGANTVRLAMYTEEYNGYCSGGNQEQLKSLVKSGVSFAKEQGLYVIIDWHILSDGNPNRHKAEAAEFFAEMADLYKDNDHVIYEICNEPNGGVSWAEIKSYAMEIISVIRARDPDGIILVGTPTWSQEVDKAAADPITGYNNIMYTLHFYADTHRDSLRSALINAVQSGLPVFVSEFGICDASGNGAINESQADLWMQTLNQYGVSYVAWNLSNKAETSALISSGCSKTSGIAEADLSESGKWLLRTLQGTAASGGGANLAGSNAGNGSGGQTASNQDNGSVSATNENNWNDNQQTNQAPAQNNDAPAQNDNVSNQWQPPEQKNPQQYAPSLSAGVEASVVTSWQEGNSFSIQYEIKVSNTGAAQQNGWSGSLTFPANAQVVSGWNANFSAQGQTVTFTNMDYNQTIAPGGKIEGIGCIVRFE